jgi:hypothetical protein
MLAGHDLCWTVFDFGVVRTFRSAVLAGLKACTTSESKTL